MRIDAPEIDAADALADLWVRLAAEQKEHGSHLQADANRETIRESLLRALVTDGVLVARAEAGDEFDAAPETILGFVMFNPERRQFETTIPRGTIQNLYVLPDYREQGLGTQLLDAATATLGDRGIEVVTLEVMADNEEARRFYSRHGFEPHRVHLSKRIESDNQESG